MSFKISGLNRRNKSLPIKDVNYVNGVKVPKAIPDPGKVKMAISKIPKSIKIFGDQDFRGDCPSESAEQISFLSMLEMQFPYLARVAVHVRNEGKRSKYQGHKQKQEGLNTGASDILIPCVPPIVIELKRKDKTKSSTNLDQITYIEDAEHIGAFACYALGAAGAMAAVHEWAYIYGRDHCGA